MAAPLLTLDWDAARRTAEVVRRVERTPRGSPPGARDPFIYSRDPGFVEVVASSPSGGYYAGKIIDVDDSTPVPTITQYPLDIWVRGLRDEVLTPGYYLAVRNNEGGSPWREVWRAVAVAGGTPTGTTAAACVINAGTQIIPPGTGLTIQWGLGEFETFTTGSSFGGGMFSVTQPTRLTSINQTPYLIGVNMMMGFVPPGVPSGTVNVRILGPTISTLFEEKPIQPGFFLRFNFSSVRRLGFDEWLEVLVVNETNVSISVPALDRPQGFGSFFYMTGCGVSSTPTF